MFTWLGVVIATGAVAGVLVAVYGPLTDAAAGPTVAGMTDQAKKAAAINAVRQTLLATTAGVAALIGLIITGRTFLLARRGQLTDRYTKAITQLASEKLEERLGGIYALEHLMVESARDHTTVVDVLAAFIREHAPSSPAATTGGPVGAEVVTKRTDTTGPQPRPATDVQAALTVLARRPDRREPHRIDLTDTDLRGAALPRARFARIRLARARLQGADLGEAQLQQADLVRAELQGARLDGAQLQDAQLVAAQLQGAHLSGAQLRNADLREARLEGANLRRAKLQRAYLGGAQFQGATVREAQLQHANLVGTQLQGVLGLEIEQLLTAKVHETTGLGNGWPEALDAARAARREEKEATA